MTVKSNMVDWTMILPNGFDTVLRIIVDEESTKLSINASDAGNWTSGRIGFGSLKGSKFGISTAQYPAVDIANLTYQDAAAIYRRDYASTFDFDNMPTLLATIMLDAAINNGQPQSIIWLQSAIGVKADGIYGPVTYAALIKYINNTPSNVLALCAIVSHMRLTKMSNLPAWRSNDGWSRRLSFLPYRAIAMLTVPMGKLGGIV